MLTSKALAKSWVRLNILCHAQAEYSLLTLTHHAGHPEIGRMLFACYNILSLKVLHALA